MDEVCHIGELTVVCRIDIRECGFPLDRHEGVPRTGVEMRFLLKSMGVQAINVHKHLDAIWDSYGVLMGWEKLKKVGRMVLIQYFPGDSSEGVGDGDRARVVGDIFILPRCDELSAEVVGGHLVRSSSVDHVEEVGL